MMVKESYCPDCGALGRSLGTRVLVGAAWQFGRLSEEVKFGLGFEKQRLL